MKKATWGIIAGIGIGLVSIALIFCMVLLNPRDNELLQAGNNTDIHINHTEETNTEESQFFETEAVINTETEVTETESTETEVIETENTEESSEIEQVVTEEPGTGNVESNSTPVVTPVVNNNPYYIKVNRTSNVVTVYGKDTNGSYTVPVKAMVCSVGRAGCETPAGVFQTKAKYTWRELFGGFYGQYATRINGHILFHSVPYDAKEKDSLITEEYNKLGQAASAGCIRLSVEDAKWIYDNCAIGVTVEIYDGNEPDPLGKPSSLTLDASNAYAVWDPTDPDANNPWKTVKPVITGVRNATLERGERADYTSYVTATDSWGNELEVKVSGTVDTNKYGNYTVTYGAVDTIGNTVSITAKIFVRDTKAPVISQGQSIVVMDSSTDVENMVRNALSIIDNGEILDKSVIDLDLAALTEALNQKSYGNVICYAAATDRYGNEAVAVPVTISYEKEDIEAPVITVLSPGTANGDLTGITDETERQTAIINAAVAGVVIDTHYAVSDDVSGSDEIACVVTGTYTGETTAGAHEVTLTITATDKSGKSSTTTITVVVTVTDTPREASTEAVMTEIN